MTYPASFAGLVRWLVVLSVTFSCFAKEKVTKKKATPVCRPCGVPCVARLVRRLRNSRYALKQSSPKPPDQPALLCRYQPFALKHAPNLFECCGYVPTGKSDLSQALNIAELLTPFFKH